MRFDDTLGYRKTQAHARRGAACGAAVASTSGAVAAVEAVRYVRQVALPNPLAGVADREFYSVRRATHGQRDSAVAGGVTDSVLYEVIQNALHSGRIERHPVGCAFDLALQMYILFLSLGRHCLQ